MPPENYLWTCGTIDHRLREIAMSSTICCYVAARQNRHDVARLKRPLSNSRLYDSFASARRGQGAAAAAARSWRRLCWLVRHTFAVNTGRWGPVGLSAWRSQYEDSKAEVQWRWKYSKQTACVWIVMLTCPKLTRRKGNSKRCKLSTPTCTDSWPK